MLIAEDLVLLVLEDVTGRPVGGLSSRMLDLLAGGALVSELALTGAVQLHPDPVTHMVEVHPTGVRIPQDPLLQRCLTLAGGHARPAPLIRSCGIDMFGHVAGRLVHQGLLRQEQEKHFLITRTSWPAAEVSYKADMRRHLCAALFDGAHPSRRTATLIALLAAVDQAHMLFHSFALPPAHVQRRADVIARSDWAAGAVRGIFRASRRRGWGGAGWG
ncbi:GPP34 family phosphoprotein, partial [Nocardioides sp. KC13]